MQRPLVVVGSINADVVLQVDRLPQPGETLGAASLETFAGGKGANQAAAAARLVYPTYLVGQVGTDGNAELLREALRDCGVNLSYVREVSGSTGTAVILLQPSGENSIIIVGGANTAAWEFPDETKQLLSSAGAVLLQREVPEEVSTKAAEVASRAGVPVILDCGGVEGPISTRLLSKVTVLSPNESELARLTGVSTDSEEQVHAAVRALRQQHNVDTVLVKRGAQGSLLFPSQGDPIRQPAFPVKKVVDTTGAGDCFTAAYAVACLDGKPAQEALRFASAAAALCVQRKGAMPSMPARAEVQALLRTFKN